MKNKKTANRIIALVLVLAALISCAAVAGAIGWNGDGVTGGGATQSGTGGYTIVGNTATQCVVGYRFSGGLGADPTQRPSDKVLSIDVMIKDIYSGLSAPVLNTRAKMWPQYTKADYFLLGFGGNASLTEPSDPDFMTSDSAPGYSKDTYDEADLGFFTALPGASSSDLASALDTWQGEDENIDIIAKLLGWDSLSAMANNDRIYIEPLFAVKIAGEALVLTPSEMAWISGMEYGWDFNGKNNGVSSAATGWGFIGTSFTHRNFPNLIFAPEASGALGWTIKTSAVTSNVTSAQILTSSLGVGIAYQKVVTVPNLVVTNIYAISSMGKYYFNQIPNNEVVNVYATVCNASGTEQSIWFYKYKSTSTKLPTTDTNQALYTPVSSWPSLSLYTQPIWGTSTGVTPGAVTLKPGQSINVKLESGTYTTTYTWHAAVWKKGEKYSTTTVNTDETSRTDNYKVTGLVPVSSTRDLEVVDVKLCSDSAGNNEYADYNKIPYNALVYVFAKYRNNSPSFNLSMMGYDNSTSNPVTSTSRVLAAGQTTDWLAAGQFHATSTTAAETRYAYVYQRGSTTATGESNTTNNKLAYSYTAVGYKITCNKPACSGCGAANCSGGENWFMEFIGSFYSRNAVGKTKATAITIPTAMGTGYESFLGYWTGKNGTGTKVIDASGNILTDVNYFTSDATVYANCEQTKVTVYYHSNGATSISYQGTAITEAELNAKSQVFKYHTANADGVWNGNNTAALNLTRTGYTFTGNWLVGSATSTKKISQTTAWTACGGGSLATGMGIDISSSSTEVHLYAEWEKNSYTDTINHWLGGLENSEGNNSSKTMYKLGSTTFSANVGDTFPLDSDYCCGATQTSSGDYAIAGGSAATGCVEGYRFSDGPMNMLLRRGTFREGSPCNVILQ